MYQIINRRGTGKTRILLEAAKRNNATVVCKNPHAMEQKAIAYGITGLNFISYRDAIDRQQHNDDKYTHEVHECLMIDELELFAQSALGMNGPLEGYTLTYDYE
ncbi:MAG: hypothetical protein E7270_01340 [Lachnospiraceae bacterium]|nr:hypothetical protein [Lachnospiraceae bacterium]